MIAKAERKGRTAEDVETVTGWLTGYTREQIYMQMERGITYKAFFDEAPSIHPNYILIKGSICGVKIDTIEDPTMRLIRCLDKMVDELAKGKSLEKVLQK